MECAEYPQEWKAEQGEDEHVDTALEAAKTAVVVFVVDPLLKLGLSTEFNNVFKSCDNHYGGNLTKCSGVRFICRSYTTLSFAFLLMVPVIVK